MMRLFLASIVFVFASQQGIFAEEETSSAPPHAKFFTSFEASSCKVPKRGPPGKRGREGDTGGTGATGDTGATGPAGQDAGCIEFGSFFTREEAEIEGIDECSTGPTGPFHGVPFDETTNVLGGSVELGTNGEIEITEPGCYEVIFGVSLRDTGGILALTLNGEIVPGTVIVTGAGNQLSTLATVVCVDEATAQNPAILQVVNRGAGDINLGNGNCRDESCEFDDCVTAFITVKKLGSCLPVGPGAFKKR